MLRSFVKERGAECRRLRKIVVVFLC